jgi:transcriptional regulator with XRE-family HTH domain
MSQNVSTGRVPVFTLGERIRKSREDLGLSQQEFADAIGHDRKSLSNWENGRNVPTYGALMLIASTADVSLEWLAGDLYRPTAGVGGAVDNRNAASRNTHGLSACLV